MFDGRKEYVAEGLEQNVDYRSDHRIVEDRQAVERTSNLPEIECLKARRDR